jgi:acetolactate synthase small subunit
MGEIKQYTIFYSEWQHSGVLPRITGYYERMTYISSTITMCRYDLYSVNRKKWIIINTQDGKRYPSNWQLGDNFVWRGKL